jgi:RNA polymerase sigma-70 factor (ECF subfamily)
MAVNHNPVSAEPWLSGAGPTAARERPDVLSGAVAVHDFRAVYDTWFADVARWIRALGAAPADQEDLIQEVFIVVHRRLPDFDGQNFAGWLYRIASHRVRDFRRSRWISQILKRSVPFPHGLASLGPTPIVALETKQKQQLLDRLLSTLSEAQRAAFVLFEMDGYTGDEIARIQQVSINTVRARIHRARKKLGALVSKWRDESRDISAGEPEGGSG